MKYILLLVCIFFTLSVSGQDTTKKNKVPVYNYVIGDSPMDKLYHPEGSVTYKYIPEFYSYMTTKNNDTTYKYECYDTRDSIVNFFSIYKFDTVKFVSLFKSYPDNAHPYTDVTDGKRKPLPVSSIIRRYDRVGND